MPTDNDRKRLRALASAVDSAENKGGGWWAVNACHLATGVLSLLDQLEAVERERDMLALERSQVHADRGRETTRADTAQAALAASQQETERLRALLGDHGIAPNKPSSAEREARAGDDHFFEGDDCDCELCGEGYMHYLHAPDHKRDEQNKEGDVEP